VVSLRTAIEFKFADSVGEVKTALSGILEDLSGYEGSRDWTRFFSVVYMTGAYCVEQEFAHAMSGSRNAQSWEPILVVGDGGRH
jgi:hypothetical protein